MVGRAILRAHRPALSSRGAERRGICSSQYESRSFASLRMTGATRSDDRKESEQRADVAELVVGHDELDSLPLLILVVLGARHRKPVVGGRSTVLSLELEKPVAVAPHGRPRGAGWIVGARDHDGLENPEAFSRAGASGGLGARRAGEKQKRRQEAGQKEGAPHGFFSAVSRSISSRA